ncbi:MAG: hypothetical protein ACXADB_13610 [Candidatus Hermodarchaeia archaeon]|jgi:hypothetical protein
MSGVAKPKKENDPILSILYELKKLRSEMTLMRIEFQNQGKAIAGIRTGCAARFAYCRRNIHDDLRPAILSVADDQK